MYIDFNRCANDMRHSFLLVIRDDTLKTRKYVEFAINKFKAQNLQPNSSISKLYLQKVLKYLRKFFR